MDWHSDIAAGLPARRDDEPRGLREAIIAEIVDHLQCSMRRELLAGRDALEARTRVLASFGDPVAVACRMWYEAMKERIIMQRLTLAAVLLMTVACTATSYLVWQGQQDTREFNAALVRKLEEIAASPRALQSDQKLAVFSTPLLRVRLVAQKPDGPPIADCSVTLFSLDNGSYQENGHSELSDDNGVADFGPVPNGKYRLLVATAQHKYLMQDLILKSGQGDLTIECPTTAPRFGKVKFEIDVPEKYRDRKLRYAATVAPFGETVGDRTWWDEMPDVKSTFVQSMFWELMLKADGGAGRYLPAANSYLDQNVAATWYGLKQIRLTDPSSLVPRPSLNWIAPNGPHLPVAWGAMEYAVLEVVAIPDRSIYDDAPSAMAGGIVPLAQDFFMTGHAFVEQLLAKLQAPSAVPVEKRLREAVAEAGAPRFTVEADRETVCKLTLPESFWASIPAPGEVAKRESP